MGRQLRSTLLQVSSLLETATPDKTLLRGREGRYKVQMKKSFDKGTRKLKQLEKGQKVYSRIDKKYYTVENSHATPRSYVLKRDDRN